ncbi:sporulation protein YunB [Ethanoligenens sp.]|uniref:sporulation protein YunB n=1 Tax=Ethanoligenens sp. TaxID=2099655 RepID=UPI0039EB0073
MPQFKRKYHMSRKRRFWLRIFCVLLALLLGYLVLNWKVGPVFRSYAAYSARSIAVRKINDAVGQVLKTNNVSYDTLMHYQKNENGEIIAVQADSTQINILKYEITRSALDALNNLPNSDIAIPIGNIFGGPLFSGRGPNVILRFSPVEDVDSSITSKFSAAGINQTKQDIYLTVHADMTVMLSDSQTTVHVQNEFMVAESILVGTVPGQYFNVPGSGGSGDAANNAFTYGSYGNTASSAASGTTSQKR